LFRRLLCLLTLLALPGLAQTPVALVTELKGEALAGGHQLEFLTYVQADDVAELGPGSRAVFSYVEGGVRYVVQGPMKLKLTASGPVVLKGNKANLTSIRPKKRKIARSLPKNLDLRAGGHLRRGEVSLHVSQSLLPESQEISFSALPTLESFVLVVSDHESLEDVYQAELSRPGPFLVPTEIWKPGHRYDLWLQARDESGRGFEDIRTAVQVLSESETERLESARQDTPGSVAAQTELLALYLHHGLDQLALESVEDLMETTDRPTRLVDLRASLRRRLLLSEDQ
jgi:hypothetical protein